ncbi:MAG: restriction endonuclease subunit S [Acidimicrobiaceae bacterium]|nr:restriction endonuclease subunit S [Acidimicrobiaceae bacterium]
MFCSSRDLHTYNVSAGDLLVAEGGDVGRAEFAPELATQTIFQNSLHRLRLKIDGDLRYVRYSLDAVRSSGWLDVLCNRTTFGHLTGEKLRQLRIPWPPSREQRAIADYLDTETARIDTLISKKRHLIALLAERKALSAENSLDRLRASETLTPLKYLVRESDVRCETNNELELLLVSIHRGVIPKRLGSNNQTASEDLSKYKVVAAGDIVINRMRAFQGGLGVAPQPGIVSPDYTVLRVGAQVSPEFLHYLLRSSWFVSEMTRRLRGIGATGQGQVRTPRINFGDLGQIEVPVPPRTVQEEIAFDLSAREAQLTRLVDLQTKQLTLLEEKRQATITAAVTGAIDVHSQVATMPGNTDA